MSDATIVSTEPVTAKQSIVLDAMFRGCTQHDAAALAGVADYTVTRWFHQPRFAAFQADYQARLDRAADSARAILKRHADEAANVIGQALAVPATGLNAPNRAAASMLSVRIAAAKTLLNRIGVAERSVVEQAGETTVRIVVADPEPVPD